MAYQPIWMPNEQEILLFEFVHQFVYKFIQYHISNGSCWGSPLNESDYPEVGKFRRIIKKNGPKICSKRIQLHLLTSRLLMINYVTKTLANEENLVQTYLNPEFGNNFSSEGQEQELELIFKVTAPLSRVKPYTNLPESYPPYLIWEILKYYEIPTIPHQFYSNRESSRIFLLSPPTAKKLCSIDEFRIKANRAIESRWPRPFPPPW